MKKSYFFGVLLLTFLLELAVLTWFARAEEEHLQDAVTVNEIMQTVKSDWHSLEAHRNHTALDYVVLDSHGEVLYRTKSGLSESINEAISHRDTILDIEVGGSVAGKLIVSNDVLLTFQAKKRDVILTVAVAMVLQCAISMACFFYLRCMVIKPFQKLKDFAQRIAGGNLDVPLEMDRQNVFGAFTESFDVMRSELKKARIGEARANASKKELVAKLSHDIKTPTASIMAASEVGAALAADEKSRENYERIHQKADQINTLVTNLFSATLEELHELSVTPADLESEKLRTLLQNADYLHRAAIPLVPACMLFADRLRLQQVFDNIFANSYKYADTNINVAVRLEDKYLVVCIEDYGGGIGEPELPLLKEKFKRGSNTKDIEGAGLGLYISDYCMKNMGGRLDVENGQRGLKVTVRIALSSTI